MWFCDSRNRLEGQRGTQWRSCGLVDPGRKTALAVARVRPRTASTMTARHCWFCLFAIAAATGLPAVRILGAEKVQDYVEVAPLADAGAESLAERELRDILERERAIWDRIEGRQENENVQLRAEAEFRDVLTAYRNLLRANPDYAAGFAAYGLLLSRVGARDEALKILLRANQLDPNLPMVKNQVGNHLTEDGEYRAALPYYLAAIELDDDEPLYHYQLGSLLYEFREFFVDDGIYDRPTIDREMQAAFRRAAELAPESWAYGYRYAESFYDLAEPDWPEALRVWGKLNARAKPGVERQTIQLHMARVLAAMDRPRDARALLAGVDEPVLAESKRVVEQLLAKQNASDSQETGANSTGDATNN